MTRAYRARRGSASPAPSLARSTPERTLTWLMMSSNWPGGIVPRVCEIASVACAPGASGAPVGNGLGGSAGGPPPNPPPPPPPPPPNPAPPPLGGPLLLGGASSVSAKSSLKPRPPTSTPWRLRRAEAAVSGSLYSQNPKPLGRPVAWSNTSLFRKRGERTAGRDEQHLDAPEGNDGSD